MSTWSKKEDDRAVELLVYIGIDPNNLESNKDHDYLTINEGSDGEDYVWYVDEVDSVAIRISDGAIFEGDELLSIFPPYTG